ncbi:MAG: hypothetical protein ACRCX2_12600 [Paraclostridium sp.]
MIKLTIQYQKDKLDFIKDVLRNEDIIRLIGTCDGVIYKGYAIKKPYHNNNLVTEDITLNSNTSKIYLDRMYARIKSKDVK